MRPDTQAAREKYEEEVYAAIRGKAEDLYWGIGEEDEERLIMVVQAAMEALEDFVVDVTKETRTLQELLDT